MSVKEYGIEKIDYDALDEEVWTFPARPTFTNQGIDIVDGDTLDVVADLGFRMTFEPRVRLYGVDTAEIYGVPKESTEYQRGQEHAKFVQKWLQSVHIQDNDLVYPLTLTTLKETGKYGRYIGDVVQTSTGSSLVASLVNEYPEVQDREL